MSDTPDLKLLSYTTYRVSALPEWPGETKVPHSKFLARRIVSRHNLAHSQTLSWWIMLDSWFRQITESIIHRSNALHSQIYCAGLHAITEIRCWVLFHFIFHFILFSHIANTATLYVCFCFIFPMLTGIGAWKLHERSKENISNRC